MSLNKFTSDTNIYEWMRIGANEIKCHKLITENLDVENLTANNIETNYIKVNDLIDAEEINSIIIDTDNLKVNKKLEVVALDNTIVNFTTPNNGNANDVLGTDGEGNCYWTGNPSPPISGIVYNGVQPAINNRLLKNSNLNGTTANLSCLLEGLTDITSDKKIISTNIQTNNLSSELNGNLTIGDNSDNIIIKSDIKIDITTPSLKWNTNTIATLADIPPYTYQTFQNTYDNSTPAKIQIDLSNKPLSIYGLDLVNPVLSINDTETNISLLKTNNIYGNIGNDINIGLNGDKLNVLTNNGILANKYVKTGGLSTEYLMADGSTIKSSQIGSNIYLYINNTDLVPPNLNVSGRINFNLAPQNTATLITINHLTDDLIDIDPFFTTINAGDYLYIQDRNNSTNWIKYLIISTSININNNIQITVSFYSGNLNGLTTFGNNHRIYFSIFSNNSTQDMRISALETKTQNITSTVLNTNTTFIGEVKADTLKINNTNNILLCDGTFINQYTLTNAGVGLSILNSDIAPTFKTKGIIAGDYISTSLSTTNDIIITNTSPSNNITLNNVGTNTLINSNANPTFNLKGLVAGSNITITPSATDITISSNGGGGGSSTFWDFLPTNISNKGSLLNNTAYFNMAIVPNTITINTIRFILPDINPANNIVRFALYKGILSSGNTCILQAQSVFTIPTNAIGLQTMTFTAEVGKSLTFNTGDLLWLTFSGTLILATFFGNGNADLDNCFLLPTNYTAGFPAFLTTGLGRIQTNIRVCGLFNT